MQEDADKNRLRAAHLSSAIRQLYHDFYEDWARRHPTKLRECAEEVLLTQQHLTTMPPGSTFLDAYLAFRETTFTESQCDNPANDDAIDQALKNPDLEETLFQHAFTCFRPEDMPNHSHLQEFLALESHGPNAEDCRTLAKLLEQETDLRVVQTRR